jgi:hypothetical protein
MRRRSRHLRHGGHVASPPARGSALLSKEEGADGDEGAHDEDKAEEPARPARSRQHGQDQSADYGRKNARDQLLLKVPHHRLRLMLGLPSR